MSLTSVIVTKNWELKKLTGFNILIKKQKEKKA